MRISPLLVATMVIFPVCSSASVVNVVITKQLEKDSGVKFVLSLKGHPQKEMDTVYISISFRKEGKLRGLQEVTAQVTDAQRLVLRVPLELREGDDGEFVAAFHMTPQLLRQCVLSMSCRGLGTAVTSYDIQLKTYLDAPVDDAAKREE